MPGMGKKANTSAIRSKQFKFRMDSLSLYLFSSFTVCLSLFLPFTSVALRKPVHSLRLFHPLHFFPSCIDATNRRSRQTRNYAARFLSPRKRRASFSRNRMPILFAASGILSNCFKVLTCTLPQPRKEEARRERVSFNSF